MARPVNANAEDTRHRIRTAASSLFAQHGLAGASVRDIAREAAVNPAMVNHYFGGKAGLYKECIGTLYEQLDAGQDVFIDALASGLSTAALIGQTVRSAYALALENSGLIRLINRDVLDRGELDPERRERVLGPFLDQASEILSQKSKRSRLDIRLTLQSLIFLTVRFSLCSDVELRAIVGDVENVHDAVADYLESFALRNLDLHEEPIS